MKVYAVGLDNDKTLCRFITSATDYGAEIVLVNLHAVHREAWRLFVPAGTAKSYVYGGDIDPYKGAGLELDPDGCYFARLVDLSPVLPEPQGGAWRHMLAGLTSFLETVSGRVVNRPGYHTHNAAKPYHEYWLARRGFLVPPAVTTSDRKRAQAFLHEHGTGIVKALCGMRGTAQAVTEKDFDEFGTGQGPVHIQQYISGYDVRVHVVGDEMYAEKICCHSIDYRERGANPEHAPTTVPSELAGAMVRCAKEMALAFTGWDFKVDGNGRYWCLEVNPMPGYDVYDRRANGQISAALLRYMTNGNVN